MLKLLAIQVQKECKDCIMRCLEPEMMYYLCNDYEISQSGNGVWQVSIRRDIKILSDTFYQIHADSAMRINVSAIVGENGSGKSTIVELILRMINNCAIHYGIRAENGMLKYVEGVYAKLFYMNGNSVYCLSMEGGEENVKVTMIASIENGELRPKRSELTSSDLRNHFFYTLVSNYSHYAYNTYDFRKEWQKQSDEDTCWLKWLFHKNDGYQTPITLHPFRDQGTVSIEREKNLSNQRLLYFFINYAKQKQEHGVFKYINGKRPKYLNLQEVNYSKLQQVTLLRYFDDNKNVMLLGNQISFVERLDGRVIRKNSSDYNNFMGGVFQPLQVLAYRTLGLNKPENVGHHHFFKTMLDWVVAMEPWWYVEHKTKLFSDNSDLRQLLNALDSMAPLLPKDTYREIEPLCKLLREYDILNLCQLQRLEILDDVCDFWHGYSHKGIKSNLLFELNPEIITEEFKDLSLKQKCYHYIVYKTIDILETYPNYHYPLWIYSNTAASFSTSVDREDKQQVQAAFLQLLEDVNKEKTHITLKMRQTFYYLNHSIYDQSDKDGYVLAGENVDGIDGLCLSTERLAEFYMNENEQNLETLPPPIYERHLLFESTDGHLIDIDTFSSGERQLLNTQSAIIYHLQNLSSIFRDPARMKYPQVNIILEEIELYFHPEYQRCFIYSLINLLEQSGISENIKDINVLIVTHSPFILSDVPKNNVLFLKEGRSVTDMQENTFGANIHTMLQNAFFLNGVTIGDFARNKINQLFGMLHNDEITEEIYQEILLVSEPFIKSQLLKMYNERYPHHQMKEMEARLAILEKTIGKGDDDKN